MTGADRLRAAPRTRGSAVPSPRRGRTSAGLVALLAFLGACSAPRGSDGGGAPAESGRSQPPGSQDAAPASEDRSGMDGMGMGSMGSMGDGMDAGESAGRSRRVTDGAPVEPGAGPAPGPLPEQPSIALAGRPELPRAALLERNGRVADRFTAPGQRVNYPFFSDAGELSILVMDAWGYARAWEAVARFRILSPAGDVVFERDRRGAATFRETIFFVAPSPGRYTLALSAPENHFRFLLTRHSNYAPRDTRAPEPVEDRGVVHGYATGARDVARHALWLEPGQEAAVALRCAEEEGRQAARAGEPGRGPGRFPTLQLTATLDGRAVTEGARFALLRAPADAAGPTEFVLAVSVPEGSPAGLYELRIDRDPEKVRVEGTVVDRFDRPVAGARLAFFREPDGDPMGATTTAADGTYAFDVMPGPYRVEIAADDDTRRLRTNVLADRELNPLL